MSAKQKEYKVKEQEDLQGPIDDSANNYVKTSERPIFTFIQQRYGVSSEEGIDTVSLTTAQIHKQIVEHTGDASITVQNVYQWLLDSGYKQSPIGDLEIYWILKEIE
jgi:hypothetical protein